MPRRNRRHYSSEQKADAVHMVRKVGNLSQVARDLELTESSLRNWVKQAEIDEGRGPTGALTSEEQKELQQPELEGWLGEIAMRGETERWREWAGRGRQR